MTVETMPTVLPFVFPADIDSPTSQQECERLFELAAGGTVLELGAWKGRTTVTMAQSAKVVHVVDHFLGDSQTGHGFTLPDFLKSLLRYGVKNRVVVHMGDFSQVLPSLERESFDLVFCDGMHTKAATEQQANWALTLAKPGGTIAFHDYGLKERGFAVTEVVDSLGKHFDLTDTLAVMEA